MTTASPAKGLDLSAMPHLRPTVAGMGRLRAIALPRESGVGACTTACPLPGEHIGWRRSDRRRRTHARSCLGFVGPAADVDRLGVSRSPSSGTAGDFRRGEPLLARSCSSAARTIPPRRWPPSKQILGLPEDHRAIAAPPGRHRINAAAVEIRIATPDEFGSTLLSRLDPPRTCTTSRVAGSLRAPIRDRSGAVPSVGLPFIPAGTRDGGDEIEAAARRPAALLLDAAAHPRRSAHAHALQRRPRPRSRRWSRAAMRSATSTWRSPITRGVRAHRARWRSTTIARQREEIDALRDAVSTDDDPPRRRSRHPAGRTARLRRRGARAVRHRARVAARSRGAEPRQLTRRSLGAIRASARQHHLPSREPARRPTRRVCARLRRDVRRGRRDRHCARDRRRAEPHRSRRRARPRGGRRGRDADDRQRLPPRRGAGPADAIRRRTARRGWVEPAARAQYPAARGRSRVHCGETRPRAASPVAGVCAPRRGPGDNMGFEPCRSNRYRPCHC